MSFLKKTPILAVFAACLALNNLAQAVEVETNRISDEDLLAVPVVGSTQLRVLSSNLLELTLITTKAPDPAPVSEWDFGDATGALRLPSPAEFVIQMGKNSFRPQLVGFKRRVVYAPLSPRDLRIGNYLYLTFTNPMPLGQVLEVKNPSGKLWPASTHFVAVNAPLRLSPAIHVNQVGYLPGLAKEAMVGYFLGTLGEMIVPTNGFQIIDARNGTAVYNGTLKPRPDTGWVYFPTPYQNVYEADFSDFKAPGEYRLAIAGLGVSLPFKIDYGIAATFARTDALGLYEQRCGTNNILPYTRFTHGICHTAPAEVPDMTFSNTIKFLTQASSDYTNEPRHTAPQLKDFNSSLYPFVRQGKIDVSGGHHDAGDYSKYTLNSAALLHTLMFAVDSLPGVAELDNLGIPESGDGKSDVMQEAKWEADFLAKMQDDDGGFYFLVYPRDREYESNVTPDHGDPQIVWPKTTAATAAAVAALAQTASSPLFKRTYPQAAELYLAKAKKGWDFIERAIAAHGLDGSYQKISHYGNDFLHDDEIAWALCEMYLATGESIYQQKLLAAYDPANAATRRWGWWRMYESYGRATRSYAFAAKSGRLPASQLDPTFLSHCQDEIIAAANDQLAWAQASAYATSFPTETKRFLGGGWYFSMDQAFDLVVACALDFPPLNDPRQKYLAAILGNLNYEAGCNPVNLSYVAGLGWRRPHEVVDQYAMNDRHALPPSGVPIGNIQSGFGWVDTYKKELSTLSFPPDAGSQTPYPFYDRWGDSFNVQTEFITVNQARALAVDAWLMSHTPLKTQQWKAAAAILQFDKLSAATNVVVLKNAELDLTKAQIVWETPGEVSFGRFLSIPSGKKPAWLEAEALLPDGRRVYGVTNF